jgi:hypothetical protein
MKNYVEIAKAVKEKNENWYQFGAKKCWWSDSVELDGDMYMILKSYDTIVAVVDNTENLFVALDKWSSTTSKQVTQFHREYVHTFDKVQQFNNLNQEWC